MPNEKQMANSVDHVDEKARKFASASRVIDSVQFKAWTICHWKGLKSQQILHT